MENEEPFQTVTGRSLAESLAVPTAGFNAFYSAKSLIDKMVIDLCIPIQGLCRDSSTVIIPHIPAQKITYKNVFSITQVLVDDDWISRAILHLVEYENLVAEGAGATSLSALLAVPDILPELHGKT